MTTAGLGLALVTGGASGIGAACARRLAQDGFEVLSLDLHDPDPGTTAAGVGSRRLDVTDEDDWTSLVADLRADGAAATALVTSAGIVRFGGVEDCTLEDFRLVQDVNLVGTFLALRHVLPLMRERGAGSAVAVSSVAGLIPKPNQVAYVVSKWGVRGMVKAAAQDLAGTGVRVNSVHPGPVRTPMTDGLSDAVFARQPMARRAEPGEVASAVSFLAGPGSSYCTGAELAVDGGHVLQG